MKNDIDRALEFLRANGFSEAADKICFIQQSGDNWERAFCLAAVKVKRRDDALRKVGWKYLEALRELRKYEGFSHGAS